MAGKIWLSIALLLLAPRCYGFAWGHSTAELPVHIVIPPHQLAVVVKQ
jgi:hypothetical protein